MATWEDDSVMKNLPANAGDARDTGLLPGSGRRPGGGNGSQFQDPCLGNPMDSGACWATVYGSQRVRLDLTTEQECICVYIYIRVCIYHIRFYI